MTPCSLLFFRLALAFAPGGPPDAGAGSDWQGLPLGPRRRPPGPFGRSTVAPLFLLLLGGRGEGSRIGLERWLFGTVFFFLAGEATFNVC